MKNCPNCDEELNKAMINASVCDHCGEPLGEEDEDIEDDDASEEEEETEDSDDEDLDEDEDDEEDEDDDKKPIGRPKGRP